MHLKALIITPTKKSFGGVETVNGNLEAILSNMGFHVEYLTLDDCGFLGSLLGRVLGMPILMLLKSWGKVKKYNLVVANGEYAFGLTGGNIVQVNHGCYSGILKSTKTTISFLNHFSLWRMAKFQNLGSRNVFSVAVSDDCKEIMVSHGASVDCVVNNGIDLDLFHSHDAAIERDIEFITIANWSDKYRKGLDLLEGLAVKGMKISCIGDPDENNRRSNLTYLGRKTQKEVVGLLARSKFFILLSRYEGLQLSPMEAMACGAVPIISDTGLGRDICSEENVLVIPRGLSLDEIEGQIEKFVRIYKPFANDRLIRKYGYDEFRKKWEGVFKRVAFRDCGNSNL